MVLQLLPVMQVRASSADVQALSGHGDETGTSNDSVTEMQVIKSRESQLWPLPTSRFPWSPAWLLAAKATPGDRNLVFFLTPPPAAGWMQARLCSLGRPVHRCLLASAPVTRPRLCCKARAVAQPKEVCPVNMVSATLQPHPDVAEILLTPEALAVRVAEVGR